MKNSNQLLSLWLSVVNILARLAQSFLKLRFLLLLIRPCVEKVPARITRHGRFPNLGPVRYPSLPLSTYPLAKPLSNTCLRFLSFCPTSLVPLCYAFSILEEMVISIFIEFPFVSLHFFPRQICLACLHTSSQSVYSSG